MLCEECNINGKQIEIIQKTSKAGKPYFVNSDGSYHTTTVTKPDGKTKRVHVANRQEFDSVVARGYISPVPVEQKTETKQDADFLEFDPGILTVIRDKAREILQVRRTVEELVKGTQYEGNQAGIGQIVNLLYQILPEINK